MVYNTVDGTTVVAKDLKAARKVQGDQRDQQHKTAADKEKPLTKKQKEDLKEREHAKKISQTK